MEDEEDCCICLDPLFEKMIFTIGCKHTFHNECIKEVCEKDNPSCPLCRAPIKEKEDIKKGNYDPKNPFFPPYYCLHCGLRVKRGHKDYAVCFKGDCNNVFHYSCAIKAGAWDQSGKRMLASPNTLERQILYTSCGKNSCNEYGIKAHGPDIVHLED